LYKLCVLQTHPVQYIAPWFQRLAQHPDVDLTVLYCMVPTAEQQGVGFGVPFEWDIPLLDGYRYQVLRNRSLRPGTSWFWGCDTPEVSRIVASGGFDACLVGGWQVKSCFQFLLAARRCGVPCIVRGESNSLKRRGLLNRLAHRWLLRQYAAMITVGALNRQFYLDHGVPASRIIDGANCVASERLAAAVTALQHRRLELRRNWGIRDEAYCFLFAAKFVRKKRPLDALRALATLQEDCRPQAAVRRPAGDLASQQSGCGADPLVHLLMVGDGALRAECEAYARAYGLPATFTGFLNQTEMPRAYAAADCLVLSSDRGETWGMVVNEAMVCGIPAVVSDRVGCHPDLIVPGVTGHTFRFGDVRDFSAKMAAMASAPDRSRELGRAAASRVAGFSFERLVADTVAALRLVCVEDRRDR
jgi:glycosyltransferase involved in cell wall biosynthesis